MSKSSITRISVIREMISPHMAQVIANLVDIATSKDLVAHDDSDIIAASKVLLGYYAGQPPQAVQVTGAEGEDGVLQAIEITVVEPKQ